MGYFDKQNTGGSIERKGLAFQDCVAVIYIFKYLSDPQFVSISFKTIDDFVFHFAPEKHDLCVQVKINQLDINFIKDLLDHTQKKKNATQCYVGSSMDDELRNLSDKIDELNNINENTLHLQAKKELKIICTKKNLNYKQIMAIKLDAIGEKYAANNMCGAILEWAEKQQIFVDTKGILGELVQLVHLYLSAKRGTLTRDELIEIINRNRVSKILTLSNNNQFSLLKERFICDIEDALRTQTRDFSDLQAIKLLVEKGQMIEYKNIIESLYRQNPTYINLHLWTLVFQEQFSDIVSLCEKFKDNKGSISLIYALALFFTGEYTQALAVLNKNSGATACFEENLLAGMCYSVLGDTVHAQGQFELCLRQRPHSALTYLIQASLNPYSKKALDQVENALHLDPKCAGAYLEKGKICRYFGENERAVEAYEKYMELTGKYNNLFILSEIAFGCYNATGSIHQKYLFYFTRWVGELIRQGKLSRKNSKKESCIIIDIGYRLTQFVVLILDKNGFATIQFNDNKEFRIALNRYYQGGIGLYSPPYNLNFVTIDYFNKQTENEGTIHLSLEEFVSRLSLFEKQKIKETAAIPTLFRHTENEDDYHYEKRALLGQNVLMENHDWEYFVDKQNIDVCVQIGTHMLNAIIRIGNYFMNIFVPSPKEGLQGFQRKLSDGILGGEAAVLLQGPSEFMQITFQAGWIKVIYN